MSRRRRALIVGGSMSGLFAALMLQRRGWDVTIYNPDLDPERVHARRIVRFIGSLIERVAKAR